MCVRNPPTFAPSPPRGAWGLVENRAALLRRRRPFGARRAVGGVTPVFAWTEATATEAGRPAGPAPWSGPGLGLCGRTSDTVH